jgi:hypothetical protein
MRKKMEQMMAEMMKSEDMAGMMEAMIEIMLGKMSKEDIQNMMSKVMGKVFTDMTSEDKQKMMGAMMPKMMDGVNMMEMMPKMMGGMMGGGKDESGKMGMMPQMMMEMMPRCLKMMLPNISKENRIDFILTMISTLVENGCVGMSPEEKKDFVTKVIEKVKT